MLCAVAGWTRGAVPGVTCGLAHCPVPLSAGQAFPDEGGGVNSTFRKLKIMASGPITAWEIDGETVSDFMFLGSKPTLPAP